MLLLHWVNLLAYFPLQLQSWDARHFSSRHKMWSCCWTCGRAVVLHFYLHHITIFEVKLVCHQHPRALRFATTDSAQWCLIWSFIMLSLTHGWLKASQNWYYSKYRTMRSKMWCCWHGWIWLHLMVWQLADHSLPTSNSWGNYKWLKSIAEWTHKHVFM